MKAASPSLLICHYTKSLNSVSNQGSDSRQDNGQTSLFWYCKQMQASHLNVLHCESFREPSASHGWDPESPRSGGPHLQPRPFMAEASGEAAEPGA